MTEENIKCPICLKEEVVIFNRMFFQTTEVKKLVIGYSCQACNHRWQVYAKADSDPLSARSS